MQINYSAYFTLKKLSKTGSGGKKEALMQRTMSLWRQPRIKFLVSLFRAGRIFIHPPFFITKVIITSVMMIKRFHEIPYDAGVPSTSTSTLSKQGALSTLTHPTGRDNVTLPFMPLHLYIRKLKNNPGLPCSFVHPFVHLAACSFSFTTFFGRIKFGCMFPHDPATPLF